MHYGSRSWTSASSNPAGSQLKLDHLLVDVARLFTIGSVISSNLVWFSLCVRNSGSLLFIMTRSSSLPLSVKFGQWIKRCRLVIDKCQRFTQTEKNHIDLHWIRTILYKVVKSIYIYVANLALEDLKTAKVTAETFRLFLVGPGAGVGANNWTRKGRDLLEKKKTRTKILPTFHRFVVAPFPSSQPFNDYRPHTAFLLR